MNEPTYEQHTKEPWHVGEGNGSRIIYSTDGWAIADCFTDNRVHDARRIVACVNALDGINTIYLENNVERTWDYWHTKQINDELLEALKKLMENNCPLTGNPSHEQLIEFWTHEKAEGRGEAVDMLFALNAIAKVTK